MNGVEERDYLWDGRGEPDADVAAIERALRPLRHRGRPPRRRRYAAAVVLALVTFVGVFAALPPRRVPARIAGLFQSNFPGEIGVRGGTRVQFRVLSDRADRADDLLAGMRAGTPAHCDPNDPLCGLGGAPATAGSRSRSADLLARLHARGAAGSLLGAAEGAQPVSRALTDEVAAGLSKRGANVVFVRPGEIVAELVGVAPARVQAWSRGVSARGVLAVTRVASDAPRMRAIAAFAASDPRAAARGIRARLDSWTGGGRRHTDPYLFAPNCSSLRSYLTAVGASHPGLAARPGFKLALESLGTGAKPGCRSYYVAARAAMSRRDIAGAAPVRDTTSGGWSVNLQLTPAGARRFSAFTAAAVGNKLAILLDGRVLSAPVVQAPITGDHVWISVAHASVSRAEAAGLAAALRNGPLAAPVKVDGVLTVLPSIGGPALVAARALFALPFALLVLGLVLALGRVIPAIDPEVFPLRPAERNGARFARRAAVTIAAIAAAAVCVELPLPLVARAALPGTGGGVDSPFALGLTPILVAFVLVEVVALAVPRWRRLRLAGAAGRARLAGWAWGVAIALAALQGVFLCQWMTSLRLGGAPMLAPGPLAEGTVVAALVAGTALLGAVAVVVERFGVGSGFAVVLLGALARAAWRSSRGLAAAGVSAAVVAGAALVFIGVVALTVVVLRLRVRGGSPFASVRLPTCGVVPAAWTVALIGVVGPALSGADLSIARAVPLSAASFSRWTVLAVAAALAVIASWLLSRPRRMSAIARIHGAAAPSRRPFAWATAASTAYVGGIVGLSFAGSPAHLGVIAMALVTAIAVDLVGDVRSARRNDDLVPVWPLQRVQLADMAMHALVERGIDVHARGLHLRALLHIFGAFAPIMLMVPRERTDEARDILAALLAPAAPELGSGAGAGDATDGSDPT